MDRGRRRALETQRAASKHQTKRETVHRKVTAPPRGSFSLLSCRQSQGELQDLLSLTEVSRARPGISSHSQMDLLIIGPQGSDVMIQSDP